MFVSFCSSILYKCFTFCISSATFILSNNQRSRTTPPISSMPSRARTTGDPLPYHVHTPPPAVPVLNLCVCSRITCTHGHFVTRASWRVNCTHCVALAHAHFVTIAHAHFVTLALRMYDRLPPHAVAPDTELREFECLTLTPQTAAFSRANHCVVPDTGERFQSVRISSTPRCQGASSTTLYVPSRTVFL